MICDLKTQVKKQDIQEWNQFLSANSYTAENLLSGGKKILAGVMRQQHSASSVLPTDTHFVGKTTTAA